MHNRKTRRIALLTKLEKNEYPKGTMPIKEKGFTWSKRKLKVTKRFWSISAKYYTFLTNFKKKEQYINQNCSRDLSCI